MKKNWNTIKQILQVIATILTSIVGALAVQSCAPGLLSGLVSCAASAAAYLVCATNALAA